MINIINEKELNFISGCTTEMDPSNSEINIVDFTMEYDKDDINSVLLLCKMFDGYINKVSYNGNLYQCSDAVSLL
ncbi:MAG: hypothetical protein ACD_26C00065G0002 [uncultured bacterium]|nr:MAG: hypothetical protein ACD_26C00065G0002 [uncultured bacterium]